MNSLNETNAPTEEEENFALEGRKKTAIIPPKHLCKGDVLTIHRGRKSVGNDSRNNWKEIYSKCSISVSLFFFRSQVCFESE